MAIVTDGTTGVKNTNLATTGAAGDMVKTNATILDTHIKDQAPHGATSANTASKIVVRNASGGFSAGGTTIDGTNSRLGVGTAAPTEVLDVTGGGAIIRGSANASTGNSGVYIGYSSNIGTIGAFTPGTAGRELRMQGHPLKFQHATDGNILGRWDAAGLRIGSDTAATYSLDITPASVNTGARIGGLLRVENQCLSMGVDATAGQRFIQFTNAANTLEYFSIDTASDNSPVFHMRFMNEFGINAGSLAGTRLVTFKSDGGVGIGTGTGSLASGRLLHVVGRGFFGITSAQTNNNMVEIKSTSNANTHLLLTGYSKFNNTDDGGAFMGLAFNQDYATQVLFGKIGASAGHGIFRMQFDNAGNVTLDVCSYDLSTRKDIFMGTNSSNFLTCADSGDLDVQGAKAVLGIGNVHTEPSNPVTGGIAFYSRQQRPWYRGKFGDEAVGPPVGTVIMFAGTSAPSGYMVCDGAAISRATYSELFDAIGTTWGAGDGSI